MEIEYGPSLIIGFDTSRTQALLRTIPGGREALSRLLVRFPDSQLIDLLSALVPLDGFLANISAIAEWPWPNVVSWEEPFRVVVEDMLNDADSAQKMLDGEPDDRAVSSEEVVNLLGPSWRGDLTKFQRRDIARLLSLGHGANFSVPGAGKTRVALAVFTAMRRRHQVTRLLVVSPKSAYEAWQFESAECFEEPLEIELLTKTISPSVDILLVNYERLNRSLPALAAWLEASPGMIVLDEAHRMKLGIAGVYGSACMVLGSLSRTRLILSGTPAPNGAKDLESLLSFVWPGLGRQVVRQAVGGGDLLYASRALRPLYTRTTKSELGLPPVETRVRRIEMPPLHREIYDAIVGRFTARAERSRSDFDTLGKAVLRLLMAATSPALLTKGATPYEPLSFQVPPLEVPVEDSLHALLDKLTQYEVPPKYEEVAAIVATNAAKGRKTLVWASFVRSILSLAELLRSYGPAVVHGGTSDREDQLKRFREDPDCTVLISNPATLGEGISLHQVCHDAVYVDRDFQAGRFLQSLDRIHRLGLGPEVDTRVTILMAVGTIDEVVSERLREKLEFMGKILDDPSVQQLADPEDEPALAAGMDMADVRALLSHIDSGKLS